MLISWLPTGWVFVRGCVPWGLFYLNNNLRFVIFIIYTTMAYFTWELAIVEELDAM
jgi:hypothetical protein